MDINFEYYKIFYYVAKYGNITKAATALGSNQPNVTRIMKILESQLGCTLFIRQARGVSLTQEGEKLYTHVEAAYRQLMNAQEALSDFADGSSGSVEIGATESALHLYMLDAINGFRDKYPRVRIKINNHTTNQIIRFLVDGRIDFAILTMPAQIPKGYIVEKLTDFDEILVGGTHYRNLSEKENSMSELSAYPWVGLGRGTATYDFYREFFLENNMDMELDMEVATSDLVKPLILKNMGIGYIPQRLAEEDIKGGRLFEIRTACPVPLRSIALVYDKSRKRSAAAERFYKFLGDRRLNL